MDRSNHYEAAFAALLLARRVPHVGVRESRRSWLDGQRIKSLDFILPGGGGQWLVDVKGRRWPGGRPERPKRSWENWATRADVVDSLAWAASFGPGSQPLFVFSYWLQDDVTLPPAPATLWSWREHRYLLRAVPVAEYAHQMRTRSPKWDTVCLPAPVFARLARPLHEFLPELRPAETLATGWNPPCPDRLP